MAKKKKSKSKAREPFEYTPAYEHEEPVERPRETYRTVLAYLLDQDEVNRLIEASSAVYVEPARPMPNVDYPTYTPEECSALVDGAFHPRRSRKKK